MIKSFPPFEERVSLSIDINLVMKPQRGSWTIAQNPWFLYPTTPLRGANDHWTPHTGTPYPFLKSRGDTVRFWSLTLPLVEASDKSPTSPTYWNGKGHSKASGNWRYRGSYKTPNMPKVAWPFLLVVVWHRQPMVHWKCILTHVSKKYIVVLDELSDTYYFGPIDSKS